jgi:uncharacterized lipoprotein YmbA
MKFMKHFLLLFLATGLIVSCGDDDMDDPIDPIAAPSNVQAGIDIADDNSGTVTVTPTATGASSFQVFFGNVTNETATTINVGQSATNVYEEGTYTIRVVAVGSDGQETEISEQIQVMFEMEAFDGGLLVNGDFEAGAEPWNAGVEAFDAPPAPVVTVDGNTYYSVTVDNPDPSQPFLVNLSQQGLALMADTNYTLKFDAWSDVERSIIAGIGESSGGFASTAVDVNLTTAMQTFTLQLTTVGFGGDDLRVIFDSNGAAGMVNIDNVSLVEGGDGSDTPMDPAGSLDLINGDFEAGAEPWNAGVEAFDAPPAPVVTVDGNTYYSVTVDNPDPSQPFLVNLSQQGLSMTADTNYTLTFDAWSDVERSIIAGIGESSGNFASVAVDVDLTTAVQTFTLQLTTVGFGGDDLRVLFDSNGEAGMVNIDNVSIVEGGDGSDTPGGDTGDTGSLDLINGDFEAGAEPWNAGVEAFDAPPAPVVTVDGNTYYSVNVENPDPSQPFLVNLSQQGLSMTADTNYILTFDAWSDVDRTIIAGIGESSGNFASTAVNVNLTTTVQTITLQLTTVGFGGDDLRVLFDSNGEAGMVNIDNVSIVEGGDGSDTP